MKQFKPGERAAALREHENTLNRELAKRTVLRETASASVNTARGIPAVNAMQVRASVQWKPSQRYRSASYFKRTAEYRKLTGQMTPAQQLRHEREQDKLALLRSAGIIGGNFD